MTDTVSFTSPGIYQLRVLLTDSLGAQSQATAALTVTPRPAVPVPLFGASSTVVYAGQPITFDGSSSYENLAAADCSPAMSNHVGGYIWDFGDGAGGTPGAATVSHAYSTAGTYNVILRVTSTDPDGGVASATHTVTVLQTPTLPLPPPPAPPRVALPRGTIKVDATGHVSIRVKCLATAGVCAGKLQLMAPKPATKRKKGGRASGAATGKAPQTIVLASASFSISATKSRAIRMRLSSAGRAAVQAAGRKGVAATLSAQPLAAHAALAPASQAVLLVSAIAKPRSRAHSRRQLGNNLATSRSPGAGKLRRHG
jgi:PKD repeat protein